MGGDGVDSNGIWQTDGKLRLFLRKVPFLKDDSFPFFEKGKSKSRSFISRHSLYLSFHRDNEFSILTRGSVTDARELSKMPALGVILSKAPISSMTNQKRPRAR